MYVLREDLTKNIKLPTGSSVAVIGGECSAFSDVAQQYKVKNKTDDGTRFAIVCDGKDAELNAYKISCKGIPYCFVSARPENLFLTNVLWKGAQPFVADTEFPDFLISESSSKKADLELSARLVFAVAEKITVEILKNGYSETAFPLWLTSPDFIAEHREEVYELAKSVSQDVDGLKQAESALLLLRTKEKNNFIRKDAVVLLAKYLSKVYNYFIKYQPSSLFPPDNNAREDALAEFFGVESPTVRSTKSEFEIRKLYYMLAHNSKILGSLWDDVCGIMDRLFDGHRMYTENNGFCLEELSEDAKFAVFMAPDLLDGDSLLSFIKDSGIADSFI